MFEKEKKKLREELRKLLSEQEEDTRFSKSLKILEKLFQFPVVREAEIVMFYASFDGEVDTFEMMRQAIRNGQTVALPRINVRERMLHPVLVRDLERDLDMGPYGICQPRKGLPDFDDLQKINAVIVPGLAFDKDYNRLGRGQGYYDRFLKRLPETTPSIGLAFNFQIIPSLPHHQDDIPVSFVISN